MCVCGPSVCVTPQSRGRWRCLFCSDSHCFIGLTAVPSVKDHSLKVKARTARDHARFPSVNQTDEVFPDSKTHAECKHDARAGIKRTVYSTHTSAGTCRHQQPRCCCSVKHKNAPVRDYGVTLVHSPRQPG